MSSANVRRDVQRASNYVLGVVLFAVSLFFAGISTRLKAARSRIVTVSLGWVIFVGAAIWIATFPVSVTVWNARAPRPARPGQLPLAASPRTY